MRYTKCYLLLVLSLAGCGQLYSETKPDPLAKIDGPESSPAGDPVQLSSKGSVGGPAEWKIVPASAAKNIFPTTDGIVFASREPGVYTFILGVAAGDRCSIAVHELNNQSDGSRPNPKPEPKPGPVGPSTGWESQLEAEVRAIVAKVGPTDEKRLADLRNLADSMDVNAELADRGGFSNLSEARTKMRESNRKVLEERTEAWKGLRDGIEQVWSQCEKDGKASDLQSLAKVWRATAKGLR